MQFVYSFVSFFKPENWLFNKLKPKATSHDPFVVTAVQNFNRWTGLAEVFISVFITCVIYCVGCRGHCKLKTAHLTVIKIKAGIIFLAHMRLKIHGCKDYKKRKKRSQGLLLSM